MTDRAAGAAGTKLSHSKAATWGMGLETRVPPKPACLGSRYQLSVRESPLEQAAHDVCRRLQDSRRLGRDDATACRCLVPGAGQSPGGETRGPRAPPRRACSESLVARFGVPTLRPVKPSMPPPHFLA